MLKIGDFARLGQVSVVTLRHYDEIGLLKPLQVDPSTGYRYYSRAQLHQLSIIEHFQMARQVLSLAESSVVGQREYTELRLKVLECRSLQP